MRRLLERDLGYFSSLDDLYWQEEARRVGERRRRTDEEDGYFATREDDMAEKQEHPAVKIEINCVCGRPLEAATYLQDGLIKLVIAPCRCAERR
jgi:hypothetical protein